MAAITTRKIEAIVHTKIDAARRRTVAKTIALDRLSAFLGDAAPALQPPALPWVDLEIRPAFREPVEICVDCPEKATNGPAFKVRFPRLVRCLRLVCSMASSGRRRGDGVKIGTTSHRWRLALVIRLSRLWWRRVDWRFSGRHVLDDGVTESRSRKNTRRERHEKKQEKTTQVLVLLEPEEVSHAARRAKPNYFDLVLGHDAAAVAAARGRASAPFAHGGTWVPRDVWAAPPRRKAPKASLVCGALLRPKYYRGDGVVLSIFERVRTSGRKR